MDLASYYSGRQESSLNHETALWQQALERAQALEEWEYQKQRDAVADSQWQQNMNYQKSRDQIADSQWQQEYALAVQKLATAAKESQKETSKEVTLESVMTNSQKWDAGQWEAYFVNLRNKYGKEKAMELLETMVQNGTLPTNMITFGIMGAGGKISGH